MKIALITDTHFGIRGDSVHFLDNTKKFLDEIFFPYLEKHKIRDLVHLGDLMDRRKYVNYNTLNRLRTDFIEPLNRRGIETFFIVGNHDIYWRESLGINAVQELFSQYARVKIVDHPRVATYDGVDVLLVPWISEENKYEVFEAIKTVKAQILFGHFELQGFEMYKGIYNDKGISSDLLTKFDVVCTGHFHHRSTTGNIHYLGSHGEFSWNDYRDDRGFHIFDTATRELEFIHNPFTMFQKVYYDDVDKTRQIPAPLGLEGKVVKVIVKSKTNTTLFDDFMAGVEKQQPIDITIVDDHLNLDLVSDSSISTEAKETLDIFKEYIAQANNVVDAVTLDKFVTSLYNEAVLSRSE